jgi:hypothetical protein
LPSLRLEAQNNFEGGLKVGSKKKPNQTRGRPLQEILFGWKIGVLKKSKREVRHAKHVAAAPLASPKPASAKII